MESRTIYSLPVNGNWVIYAPFINLTALVNQQAVSLLCNSCKNRFNENNNYSSVKSLVEMLKDSELNHPEFPNNSIAPDFLGIIPTRYCNCNCRYCDFGSEKATFEKMEYKTAVNAVNWYVERQIELGKRIIDIQFFGGEPMMFPDIVEVVVHRAKLLANCNKMKLILKISTNGHFAREYVHFLGKYFTSVVLSLDGNEKHQLAHRPLKTGENSFDRVFETAKILSDSNTELILRACISNKNVSAMEEIAELFCEELNPDGINFEILQESETSLKYGLRSPDPFEFAVNFIKSQRIVESYGIKAIYSFDITNNPAFSSCPVGKDAVILNSEGHINSCYLLDEKWKNKDMNLNIGFISQNGEIIIEDEKVKSIRNLVKYKPRCKSCFCRWSCAGGCHVENTYPGSSESYNNFCRQTRLISICSLLKKLNADEEIEYFIKDEVGMVELNNQRSDLLLEKNL